MEEPKTHPYQALEGKHAICIDTGNVGRVMVHRVWFKGELLCVDLESITSMEGSSMVKPVPAGERWTASVVPGCDAYAGWRLEEEEGSSRLAFRCP